jgi:alpha-beta hydrolase superfamily lysophospholipase
LNYVEESVATSDGLRLHLRRCEAESPRAEALIVHGFGEHSGRYGALTDHLVKAGYSVTAYDHRGHGQSEGLPGHIESFSLYEDDLHQILTRLRLTVEYSKLFIIAHSMGGLVTLRYLSQSASRLGGASIAGAVISAPLIAVAAPVPAHKLMIGRVAARVAPRLRLDNEVDPSVLSRDPEVGRAYAADPLVNRRVSARWFSEAVQAMNQVVGWAPEIKVPVLLMHGTADRLASFEATRQIYQQIGSADKDLIAYQGYYHELFNEPEREEIFRRVTEWLDARCG